MDKRIHRVIENDLFQISHRLRSIDPFYVLVFNSKVNRYEIHDTHPKVHPNHTMLIRVQTEGCEFRLADSRDLTTLLEMRSKTPEQVWTELQDYNEARDRAWQKKTDDIESALRADLRYAGRDITQSIASRSRSSLWIPRRDI